MPNLESMLTHINGLEAKKALKNNVCERIDKIKYLVQGSAFPRIKCEYALIVTAYPADIPVPECEFMFIINSPVPTNSQLQEQFDKIEIIEQKREQLLKAIERCDSILDLVRPTIMIEDILDAGNVPDEFRIENNLPVPMIQTSESGRRSEVYVDAKDIGR